MKIVCPEEENIIKDIRNLFRLINKNKITLELKIQEIFLDQKKKLKQLKVEYLEILRIFLSIKKKKIYNYNYIYYIYL